MRKRTLEDQIFDMRMSMREMERAARKAEEREKAAKKKVKIAIEKGLQEQAAIHATTAIRAKNEALNMLRIASRVDAVVSQLQSFAQMNNVTNQMRSMTNSLDVALKNMDMTKVTEVMSQFERQFEELEVRSQYAEEAMATGTATTAPQDQVDQLISQVATEAGLELSGTLSPAGTAIPAAQAQQAPAQPAAVDSLAERYARL